MRIGSQIDSMTKPTRDKPAPWHPGMDLPHKLIRLSSDDRGRSATSRAGETAREDPSPAEQLDGFFGQVTLPVVSPGGEPGSMRTNAPNWTLNWKRDIYSTGNDRMAISRIGIGIYDRICRRSSRLSDPSATNPCAFHMEDLRSTGESDWFCYVVR